LRLILFANGRVMPCSSLQAPQHSSIPHFKIPLRGLPVGGTALARCAPFFRVLVSTRLVVFQWLSRNQDGLNYSFDYSPRRGFGFFNYASFTLTKLAVAGLSSKGLSSNKNYQKNQVVISPVIRGPVVNHKYIFNCCYYSYLYRSTLLSLDVHIPLWIHTDVSINASFFVHSSIKSV
jgi:hypothetical protein